MELFLVKNLSTGCYLESIDKIGGRRSISWTAIPEYARHYSRSGAKACASRMRDIHRDCYAARLIVEKGYICAETYLF